MVWLVLAGLSPGVVTAQESGPSASVAQKETKVHPLTHAIAIAKKAKEQAAKLKDYEGTLTKKELIGNQLVTQVMQIRVRREPFSVYLKYAAPNEGREVIFDQGQDAQNLLVHEGAGLKSLAGTLTLPIRDPRVMAEARHPVSDLGLERLAELVIQQWEYESKYGEFNVSYHPEAKFGQILCEAIVVTHPRPRKQFPYHETRLFIEKQSGLPLRVQNFGFPHPATAEKPTSEIPLVEDYAYTGLKTNLGLRPLDFSRTNPDYRFK